jgi:uncharacterized protein (TIGR02246 family)
MRRISVIALLILAASIPAPAQNQNKLASTSQSTVAESIITNEKQIFEALKKKDANGFKSVMTNDAIIFGRNGRISIANFSRFVFGPDYSRVSSTVEEPQVMMVEKDVALLTYKTTVTETYRGHTETTTSYASTVWVNKDGKWMAIFHQESKVPESSALSNANR